MANLPTVKARASAEAQAHKRASSGAPRLAGESIFNLGGSEAGAHLTKESAARFLSGTYASGSLETAQKSAPRLRLPG